MTKEQLLQAIPIGEKNAIHMIPLAERLGVDTTTLKKCIRQARREGADIISGLSGYWQPETDHERKMWVSSMRKQALTRLTTSKHIRHYLRNNTEGQAKLSDYSKDTPRGAERSFIDEQEKK